MGAARAPFSHRLNSQVYASVLVINFLVVVETKFNSSFHRWLMYTNFGVKSQ